LLFDHSRPLGNGHLFPAGELREPPGETRRADMICFTRCSRGPVNFDLPIPQIKTHLRLDSVIRMDDEEVLDVETLKNEPVAAFCGIAKPEGFKQILLDSQIQLKFFKAFADHHPYTLQDIEELEARAIKEGARFLLVSEKDAVKLKGMKFSLPVFKVVIELEILEGRKTLDKKLLGQCDAG
ncbi:MAG: tetraacyldisaccharide 4'-kinase, partial [Nitrospina sp.]|nr:tetraacyldisaccharide 4'-kinase [Nitrospina sp.]